VDKLIDMPPEIEQMLLDYMRTDGPDIFVEVDGQLVPFEDLEQDEARVKNDGLIIPNDQI
jgi:hypothetical protein